MTSSRAPAAAAMVRADAASRRGPPAPVREYPAPTAEPTMCGGRATRVPAVYSLPPQQLLESARNVCAMHCLERIARSFEQADIPLMVLKGAALHLTLYGRPDERPMGDLDLLIRPEHADRACALLRQLGAVPGEPLVREDFFPRFYYERELSIGDISPVKIDVHVRPFRPLRYARLVPDRAFWNRAKTVRIGATRVLVPSAEEMLIHLTVHAAVHGNARSMWLRDIQLWADSRRKDIDWDCFVSTVKQWRLALPATCAIEEAEARFGEVCPPAVLERLRASRRNWRDRLALWHAPRDVDHPVAHVLVNALCTPGWRFVLSYLRAVLVPGREHMRDWYGREHRGWLACAHAYRFARPVVRHAQPLWHRFSRIEIRECAVHGKRVFAIRDIEEGRTIARAAGHVRFLKPGARPNARVERGRLVALRPIRAGQEIRITPDDARDLF